MHVTQIESNILSPNGQPYSFQLGRLTLLTGRNGSGKSTLSNAVRLALTGTADVAGKTNVKDAQLLQKFLPTGAPVENDGSHLLFSAVTFNDNTSAHWGIVVEPDGTVKRPQHEPHSGVDLDRVLALRSVWTLLQGDEKIARRTLLTWIGQGVSEEDALALIPTHLHGKYRDIAEKQPGTVVDKVVAVAEYAAQRTRNMEIEAAAQERLVEQLSGTLTVKPDAATLEEARGVVTQWRTLYEQARGWEEPPSMEVYLEKQRELLTAQQAVEQWGGELDGYLSSSSEKMRHEWLYTIMDEETCAAGKCPACGATPGRESLLTWSAWHFKQAKDPEGQTRHSEISKSLLAWEAEAERLKVEVARLEGQQVALSGRPRPPLPLADCEKGLRDAESYLSSLERSTGNWETVKRARDTAAEARSSKPAYQELAAACNKAVTDLLYRLTETFCARAQTYLPDRWKIGVNLESGLEIGYVRNGTLETLLSDTELDALAVATTMAVADLGGGGGTKKKRGRPAKVGEVKEVYTLVIPADRGRDSETLGELMRCWGKFSGQVIVEATEPPKGRAPKDWTIIDVGEWRRGFLPKEMPVPTPEQVTNGEAKALDVPSAGQSQEVDVTPMIIAGSGGEVHSYVPARTPPPVEPPPTPPSAAPPPQERIDHADGLRAVGFKEKEIERLRYTEAGAAIVAQGLARKQVLITNDSAILFSTKGVPTPYALGAL